MADVPQLSLALNRALGEAYDLKNIVEAMDPVEKSYRLGLPAVERTAVMGPPPSPNRDEHPYVGMLNFQGILIYIENEPGSIREGRDSNGQPWRVKMQHYYGEIPGTSGSDGDPIDVYVGPNPAADTAFVIHQETYIGHEHAIEGAYDEDKVMLGFSTREEALRAYADHFSYPVMAPGVTPIPVDELREKLDQDELNWSGAVVKAQKPAGRGWQPIPKGKKGGYRKKVGGKWTYWYPEPVAPKPKPQRQHAGRDAPGSQLPVSVQKKLRELGVSKLPAADVPRSDIEINTNPRGIHTRAVISWRDAAGRRQNGYTPEFHKNNADKKWKRILRFRDKVPAIKAELVKAMQTAEPGTPEHQGAVVAYIVAATGLRPGNEPSVSAGRFGVSTMGTAHVAIDGPRVSFSYVGKSGKVNTSSLENAVAAKAIQHYLDNPSVPETVAGNRMFLPQSLGEARKHLPAGMQLKDFRTILATETAVKALNDVLEPPPLTGNRAKDKRLLLKAIHEASSKVARALNNTTAVAKQSYIHPMVFERWARDTVKAHESLWKEQ